MARDKKGFVLYADQKELFDQLPNEKAGELIKHIFAYVNDEDPQSDDIILNIAFTPIKQALKRDLKKYEAICERNQLNGSKGGRKKAKEPSGLFGLEKEPNKPDTDKEKDTDTDTDINYKKTLLSKLAESDFENPVYFQITKAFHSLFSKNLTELNISTAPLDKAKGSWIDDVRLLIVKDRYTLEDLRAVFKYLETETPSAGGFLWKRNILSTSKLREKFDKLLIKSKENESNKQNNKKGCSASDLADTIAQHFAIDSEK